jgi:NADPH:quinone reductase-like Zn-dependent oxidoreductase
MRAQFTAWYGKGRIAPIRPLRVYDVKEVVDAFRYMQQGNHLGKILIRIPQDPAKFPAASSKHPSSLSPNASYLLVGGMGGIGRSVATWMVERGARCFVFLSRSAGKSGHDQRFVRELEDQGCDVVCVPGSVAELADVEKAIAQCPFPLSGVLQMSGVLQVSRIFT